MIGGLVLTQIKSNQIIDHIYNLLLFMLIMYASNMKKNDVRNQLIFLLISYYLN